MLLFIMFIIDAFCLMYKILNYPIFALIFFIIIIVIPIAVVFYIVMRFKKAAKFLNDEINKNSTI